MRRGGRDRRRGDREGDGDGDRGDAGAPAERDCAAVGADGEGARGRRYRDQAIAGAGAGAEGQPGGVVTGAPGQRAAAGVADIERLIRRVGPALGGRKGETGRAHADGGGDGRGATVKETGTVTGVTPVPPLSVTVPLWVPTAREPVAAVNVTRPLPVPEPGLRVNQGRCHWRSRSTCHRRCC